MVRRRYRGRDHVPAGTGGGGGGERAHRPPGRLHAFAERAGAGDPGAGLRQLLLDPQNDPTPTTELLLYAADRAQHVQTVIKPALERGQTVITDRYTASTVAYQHYGRGLPLGTIVELNRLATGGLWPKHTILLDLDPKEAAIRTGRWAAAGADA